MKLSKEQLVQRMKSEITEDVIKGRVPTTVKSFSELHDYVDANCYGGLCDPEADFDTSDQAEMDIANAAQTEVSQWLARGGLFDAALTLAEGDRLAAFASLGVKQVEAPIPAPDRRTENFNAELQEARIKPEAEAKLPEDPEWSEGSPNNADRASFAELALRAYNQRTGSDLETVIKDLIGDLGHFCDRHGLKMSEMIHEGAGMYSFETSGKGTQFEEV